MKTILIATDFSEPSRNASLYGWQLGKAMKANVILLTAYEASHPIAALNVQVSHFDVRMQTEKKLSDEANAITNEESPQMEIVCEEGVPEEVIVLIAAEKKADLIIVGMQGKNRNWKRIFGSTATSLIEGSDIPVVVVPEEAKYSDPKNILYASDIFLDVTIKAIDQIKWVTDLFSSKLHVVRVVNDGYQELVEKTNTPHNLRKELKTLGTTFNFPIYTNITDGIINFMRTEPVDLMIMMTRKREWIERIFVESQTTDMVFHTTVPLLVLSEPKVSAGDKRIAEIEANAGNDGW